jgi:hypothetical protein
MLPCGRGEFPMQGRARWLYIIALILLVLIVIVTSLAPVASG